MSLLLCCRPIPGKENAVSYITFAAIFLTGITFSVTARDEAGALRAGAGVSSWSEQTQVAAGSFTRILHCRDKEMCFDSFISTIAVITFAVGFLFMVDFL